MVELIGYLGLGLLLSAWVPQTLETLKQGHTNINLGFVILYVVSSFTLALYAFLIDDAVFLILNALLTVGSGINLYFKLWPRKE